MIRSAALLVPSAPLLAQLAALSDPRVDRAKRHSLTEVLAIALLATLCGADTYSQFTLFGATRQAWPTGSTNTGRILCR